jgi:hypothetical protein
MVRTCCMHAHTHTSGHTHVGMRAHKHREKYVIIAYCFSTVKRVTRKSLSITLYVHWLSCSEIQTKHTITFCRRNAQFEMLQDRQCTRWFKYDRDKLWLVYTQLVPVISGPPCTYKRDSKACSFNHCYRGNVVSLRVCVCSFSYPACNTHAPYYIVICGLFTSIHLYAQDYIKRVLTESY